MIHSKPTRNETSRTLATAVALGLLVYGSIAVARNFGILQPYELLAYDLGLTVRQMQQPASRYVTIVEVTEPDIAALGRWPLSDEQLSDALERVGAAAPRAIGLDIYRDIEVPPAAIVSTACCAATLAFSASPSSPTIKGRESPDRTHWSERPEWASTTWWSTATASCVAGCCSWIAQSRRSTHSRCAWR